jgi:predicted transcriptional regulator of viral defense system
MIDFDILKNISQYDSSPISNTVVSDVLSDYKYVRNKTASMVYNGELIRLKNGLFIVSEKITNREVPKELIANHLYGPSYVSLETALFYYGLIPERVEQTMSMSLKHSNMYKNVVGTFCYVHTSADYYPIGIRQVQTEKVVFMIASPEKALCDLIVTRPYLRIQSGKAMGAFLEEDMRIDFDAVESWNLDIIKQCAEYGKKKRELLFLLEYLQNEE